MTELKPCPKCGSYELNLMTEHPSGRQTIHCTDCHEYYDLELNMRMDKSELIDKWNEYVTNWKPPEPKITLKPCPFCGTDDLRLVDNYNGGLRKMYHVECNRCHARSQQSFDSPNGAIQSWNRRVSE